MTCLHIAAKIGQYEMVLLFLNLGAVVDARDIVNYILK